MLSVLDPQRIAAHTRTLAAVAGAAGEDYFAALSRIEGRASAGARDRQGPRLVFDLDDRARALLTRILAESQLPDLAVERLSPAHEQMARDRLVEALTLLSSYHPGMPANVRNLIDAILFAQVERCAGGSSIDALATVWVSPRPEWSAARYAECLCHELVHQALFLEDMLAPIFQDIGAETLIVSSIRRCKRPYESSFHAAVVAGALIEMYVALGLPDRASEFSDGLAESVDEFVAMPQHLSPRGLQVLAELEQIATAAPRGPLE